MSGVEQADNGAAGEPAVTPSPRNSASKERQSLTLEQRRALRKWANSQAVRPSQRACIEWFRGQYQHTISQSTVSHSLSPKYARLDGDPQLSGSRLRFGNWPDVEKLVLLWHQQTVNNGRHPSNEELAEKAKAIFMQLPRYKDEPAPEFSPGWIHRFKKRYGLLIRRQRRHGTAPNPADDIPYLVDTVPRFMNITADVSPAAIRESVQRVVGVEASLATCARVRDEIVRRMENPTVQPHPALGSPGQFSAQGAAGGNSDTSMFNDEDAEVVLQNALRQLQEEELDAEAQAAVAREERDRADRALGGAPAAGGIQGQYVQNANALATPVAARTGTAGSAGPVTAARFVGTTATPQPQQAPAAAAATEDLNLTPIQSAGPVAVNDRPVRCPFCVNQRMLRTIKEAVEHMSTHVVV